MQKRCEACDKSFEAKRGAHRFCSATCRKRNQRKATTPAPVVHLVPTESFESDPPEDPGPSLTPGPTETATRAQLETAGRLDTALGVAAVIAAMQLDYLLSGLRGTETGSGIKALLEAHRTALAEAVKDSKAVDDPLSKIRAAAALKLVRGGRS